MSDLTIDSPVNPSIASSPTPGAGGEPPQSPPGSPPIVPDAAGDDDANPPKDSRWYWLKVGQYLVLSVVGGTPPYTYSISFNPEVITPPITDQISQDGKINHELQVSGDATPGEVGYVIEIKAKNGKAEKLEEESQKITVVAGP